MSRLRVDELYDRAKTGTPHVMITPALNDDSKNAANTEWCQNELGDRVASQSEVEAGTSTSKFLTPENLQYSALATGGFNALSIAAVGGYDPTGQTGTFSMNFEDGDTFTPTRNEVGSVALVMTTGMANANYVVLAIAIGTTEVKQINVELENTTTTSFTLTTENDSGVNVDSEVRFVIIGQRAEEVVDD